MSNNYKTPFRVINASAGSGKTFALTRAYLTHLLGVKGKRPFKNQLALTFTNKAVDEMKTRILERLVNFSKGQNVDDQMATYLMSDLKIGSEELEKRSDHMLQLILKDYGAFQVMTIDKFTNRIVNVFSKDFGLSQNFEIELELEKMADDIIHSIVWEVSQNSDDSTTTKFKDFAREMSYRHEDWDPIKPLKKLLKEIYNENNKNDIDKFKIIDDEQLNEIQSQLNDLRKNLKVTINKAISDSKANLKIELSLAQSENLKIVKAIADLEKFLEKITNLISINSEELKPFMYGGSRSNLGKEKLKEFRDEVGLEIKRFTLINKILRNWIPFSMLQTLSNRIQNYQHVEQRMLLNELNHKVSEVVKNSPAPFIYERFGEQFKHYYVDEFQDTSVLQWENLIPLIDNSLSAEDVNYQAGSLLIVGDPKQAIYRWRGGKREQLVDLIFKDVEPFVIKQEIEELDTNYRSRDNIVLFNNEFYQHACNLSSDEEFQKTFIRSATSLGAVQKTNGKPGGYVQVELVNTKKSKDINSESIEQGDKSIKIDNQSYDDRIIDLEQQERDLYLDSKFSGKPLFNKLTVIKTVKAIYQSKKLRYRYHDIGILVRSNNESTVIAEGLTEYGIPFISEGSLKLNNSEDVQLVLNLVHLTIHQNDKAIQKKLLDRLWTEYEKSPASPLIDYHDFVNNGINKNQDINSNEKSTDKVLDDVKKWINHNFQWNVFINLNLFEAIEYVISSFNFLNLENVAIRSLLEVVYEFSNKGKATFHDFLEFWEARKDKLSFESPGLEECVTVLTAHKAKGLEFPIVIIPFVVEEFKLNKPGEARTDWVPIVPEEGLNIAVEKAWLSIRKEDFVDYHGGALKATYERLWSEHLNEEMNILYVATTRASEALFLIINYDEAKKDVQAIPKLFGKFFEDQIESTNLQFDLIEPQVGTKGFSLGEFRRYSKSDGKKPYEGDTIDVNVFSDYKWLKRIIKRVKVKSDPFIQRGTKTHAILEKLINYQDIDRIIEKHVKLFWDDEQLKGRIRNIMHKIVNHPEISICYRQPSESVYCEQGLLAPSSSPEEENNIRLVPDRVVVLQDKVIVLDYKTGKPDDKHHVQLEKYISVVKKIHEKPAEAFLVYIDIEEQAISVKKLN